MTQSVVDKLRDGAINLWKKGGALESLRGPVSNVSRSAHVSGDSSGVSTSQVITCQIEKHPVEIWMPSVPMIDPGDELIVAGRSKFGKLEAMAFRNFSNGTSGRWDYQIYVTACVIASILIAIVFSCVTIIFIPALFLLIPALIMQVRSKYRIYEAYKLVMSESAKPDEAITGTK